MPKKFLIPILIVSFLFIGSVGAGFYMLYHKISTLESNAQELISSENDEGEEELDDTTNEIGLIYPLETFVVNLADDKQRFIRVSMSLEYSLDDKLDEIEGRIPQIKDAILTFIPTKTSEELKMVDGKKDLRENLITQLNSFFSEEIITNIYFTEFVIQ